MSLNAPAVTSPAPRPAWRAMLACDAEALVAQSPEWIDCMLPFGYEDASRLYEMTSGTQLVLPMVRRAGALRQRLAPLASMPSAWGMGGLICSDRPTASDLTAVVGDLRDRGLARTRVRPNPLRAADWVSASGPGVTAIPRLAHVLDLDADAGRAWKGLTKKARAGVRKAERSGLEIECDTSGRLVPVFQELLELSIERWARQQREPLALARWRARRRDPHEKFKRMAVVLGDTMRVWVASKDGVPAASMIVLIGANASDTRGAMNKEIAAPTNANDLLQWLAIEDACNAGCRSYHMGESGSSRALSHFKEKFGARPVPYAECCFERIPFTAMDRAARSAVKRVIGFRD